MRIILINPRFDGEPVVDIGLTQLASYLHERTPHRAQLIDFTFHRKDWKKYLKRRIDKHKPDLVGITTFSMHFKYACMIASEIKSLYHLPVILGGYHPTLMPEESLAVEGVDAICIGDGEFTLAEYLDALEEKRSPEGIKGLWVKHNGQVLRNPLREWNQDLDSLPIPDYDLWEDIDKYLYYFGLCFVGNRGCPFSCTYCSEAALRQAVPGKRIRQRSPRAYAQEIKYQWEKYKKRGMEVALLYDPIFPFDKSWVREFCDEYQRLGLSTVLPFSCFIRADNTIDEERIAMLAASNLQFARIGIEAGNDVIRREVYGKDISIARFKEVCRLLQSYGISPVGCFILGGPGETKDTMQDTFNCARELDLGCYAFFIYNPLPKTESTKQVLAFGGSIAPYGNKISGSYFEGYNVRPKDLSPWIVRAFRKKCTRHFGLKTTLRLVRKQKLRFFVDLPLHIIRGAIDGIGIRDVIGHYYENNI